MKLSTQIGPSYSKYLPPVFLLAVFAALFLLFRSTFGNPPRSDYWAVFYVFHQVDIGTGQPNWMEIINHDPWRHGTFRPLSHLILYWQHAVFGSNFIGNRIVNFAAYCLSLWLLYLLAVELSVDRWVAAFFIGLAAFFFSHFDIITWTFHVFILLAFSAFLTGFILYGKFLKTGRRGLLYPIIPLFLFGMLCSEIYSLWPLGLLIFGWGGDVIFPGHALPKRRILAWEGLLLGLVYVLYFASFLITRAANHTTGSLNFPSLGRILIATCAPFFNLLYTGIGVNLVQLLNLPVSTHYNLDMGGKLLEWRGYLAPIVALTGGAVIMAGALLAGILLKRKKLRAVYLLGFVTFLLLTNFFVVSIGRATTNILLYVFVQFRYQFVPNALTALLAAVAIDALMKPSRREKLIIAVALIPVLVSNILTTAIYINILNKNLEPLKTMIAGIREAIQTGKITPEHKLYIDERVTREFSSLCWNQDMGRFMKGTYQWMFSREEISSFTLSRSEASWVIQPGAGQTMLRLPNR